MELPDIHEAKRLVLHEGDILVLKNCEIEIDRQQADDIKRNIRQAMGKPDFPVVVLGRDWDLEVVEGCNGEDPGSSSGA